MVDRKRLSLTPTSKLDILKRLHTVEGHTRGVYRMVESDANSIFIMRQIHALHGSLRKVRSILIEDYLSSQFRHQLESPDHNDHEGMIGEFTKLLNEEGL
jgi:DNA-binding FrmR family transcriptional regulator